MSFEPDLQELRARASEVAGLLKFLSHPNRLLIACELTAGEKTVSALEAATGAPQPTLSRDLARMRDEGLVIARRESKSVYYRLGDDRLARVLEALCEAFGPQPERQKNSQTKRKKRK